MKLISVIITLLTKYTLGDLRMASSPKNYFIVQNGENAIPYTDNSIAFYMEPDDFEYEGLKNQRKNNFDNFLRSNIDNEQDNRNFESEVGRDMLPFRTFESNVINANVITTSLNQETLIPLRWNNPHSSECEINIWVKSSNNNDIVIPIKKPSCCGEGYQDNTISFKIPNDFPQLSTKIPGFVGCNNIGDCTLQIYAHSVEPRTYAIGSPIIINGSRSITGDPAINNSQIGPSTVDPQLNINILPRDVCLSTIDPTSDYISAVPRFARLVSDQFNHAYQNSNYSPYSGQQHELISRNLQSATILRMTAANGGELGKSIINSENKKFISDLINKVNNVVQKYEKVANNIFNSIKNDYITGGNIGNQRLANCFRCSDTGSVNTNRIEQQTYIPSFEIKDLNQANQIRNSLQDNVKNLIPPNSNKVQIYTASLVELVDDFVNAANIGFMYQPAMVKNTITTMSDVTNFRKIDSNGSKDSGVYASKIASKLKIQNMERIMVMFNTTITTQPTTQATTRSIQPSTQSVPNIVTTNAPPVDIPPNPDDIVSMYNFCGQTINSINCNMPCNSGMDYECVTGTCFYTNVCMGLP